MGQQSADDERKQRRQLWEETQEKQFIPSQTLEFHDIMRSLV